MIYRDRQEAGQLLAAKLSAFKDQHPVVLALPRGGVPIGFEIARVLAAPLDLVLVRKIGAPQQQELALGALADGAPPELVLDRRLVEELAVSPDYIEQARAQGLREIERRRGLYLANRPPVEILGRLAIVVDDGIATGATMEAALRATRRRSPSRLILAVPVASPAALRRLRGEADAVVCLNKPANFHAVGQFYDQFPQLRDEEVIDLLDRARAFVAAPQT